MNETIKAEAATRRFAGRRLEERIAPKIVGVKVNGGGNSEE